MNLLPETVARLAQLPNIVGIKEATGDLNQGARVIRLCPDDFIVLSGDDFTAFPLMCIGGRGVISVVSNVAPKDMADMCNAFFAGDLAKARQLHYQDVALNGGNVLRDQSGAGQDGPENDGQDYRRSAAAALPYVGCQ